MIYDAIIIGGGPAGLMAATIFNKNKLNFLLLEKNEKVGKKLLLSGGKKCNVTNNLSKAQFIEQINVKHKKALYKALSEFGPEEIIEYFKTNGLVLELQEDFKYFPSTKKSASVVEVFTNQIDKKAIKYLSNVKHIDKKGDLFEVALTSETFLTKNVLVATGSNAYPTTGSSGDGLLFAKRLGLKTIEFTPAETYVYSSEVVSKYGLFQGVAFNTELKIIGSKQSFKGGVLFTHFGLSGPAVLHASEVLYEHLNKTGQLSVSMILSDLTKEKITEVFDQALIDNEQLYKTLDSVTTKRVSKYLTDKLGLENKKLKEIAKKDINRLLEQLINFQVTIDRVESKEKAFVNAGGLNIKELNPQTFETLTHKGLYFVGETIDLQGPIGGFNITIALSTGRLAANHIVKALK